MLESIPELGRLGDPTAVRIDALTKISAALSIKTTSGMDNYIQQLLSHLRTVEEERDSALTRLQEAENSRREAQQLMEKLRGGRSEHRNEGVVMAEAQHVVVQLQQMVSTFEEPDQREVMQGISNTLSELLELASLRSAERKMYAQLAPLHIEVQRLEREIIKLQAEKSNLQLAAKDVDSRNASMLMQVQEKHNKLIEETRRILNETVEAKNEIEESLVAAVSERDELRDVLRKRDKEDMTEELRKERDALKTMLREFNSTTVGLRAQIAQLEQQAANSASEREELVGECEAWMKESERLLRDSQQLRDARDQLRADLERALQESSERQAALESLRLKNEDATRRGLDPFVLKKENDDLRSENADLTLRVKEVTEYIDLMQSTLKEQVARLEDNVAHQRSAQAALHQKEAELAAADARYSDVVQQLEDAITENEKTTGEYEKLAQEVEELRGANGTLQDATQSQDHAARALSARCLSAEQRCRDLSQRISELEGTVARLQREAEQPKSLQEEPPRSSVAHSIAPDAPHHFQQAEHQHDGTNRENVAVRPQTSLRLPGHRATTDVAAWTHSPHRWHDPSQRTSSPPAEAGASSTQISSLQHLQLDSAARLEEENRLLRTTREDALRFKQLAEARASELQHRLDDKEIRYQELHALFNAIIQSDPSLPSPPNTAAARDTSAWVEASPLRNTTPLHPNGRVLPRHDPASSPQLSLLPRNPSLPRSDPRISDSELSSLSPSGLDLQRQPQSYQLQQHHHPPERKTATPHLSPDGPETMARTPLTVRTWATLPTDTLANLSGAVGALSSHNSLRQGAGKENNRGKHNTTALVSLRAAEDAATDAQQAVSCDESISTSAPGSCASPRLDSQLRSAFTAPITKNVNALRGSSKRTGQAQKEHDRSQPPCEPVRKPGTARCPACHCFSTRHATLNRVICQRCNSHFCFLCEERFSVSHRRSCPHQCRHYTHHYYVDHPLYHSYPRNANRTSQSRPSSPSSRNISVMSCCQSDLNQTLPF